MTPSLTLNLLLATLSQGFFLKPPSRPQYKTSYQPPGQRKAPLSLTAHLLITNYRPSSSPGWTPLTDSYGPPVRPNQPPPPPSDSYGPPRPGPVVLPPIVPFRPVIPIVPPKPKPNFNLLGVLSDKLARIWAIKTGLLQGIIRFNPF